MSVWRDLDPLLRWGAIVFFVLAAVAAGASFLQFRYARLAPYYILRETARKRGLRWLMVVLVSLAAGSGMVYFHAHPPQLPITPSPRPMPLTATATVPTPPAATRLPLPTPLPSPSATRRPTATPPFIPTPTSAYPLPESALSPLPGAVPAAPEAQITFVTFALGEENGRPVDPGFEFAAGDFRVYFFYEYEDMTGGAAWTFAWYQEGEYVEGNTCLWGVVAEACPRVSGRSGSSYLYLRMPDGYEPGIYEVRVWIETRFQAGGQFTVR